MSAIAALNDRTQDIARLVMATSVSEPRRRPKGDGEVLHGEVRQRRVDPGLCDLGPDSKVLVDLNVQDAADSRLAIESIGEWINQRVRLTIGCVAHAAGRREHDLVAHAGDGQVELERQADIE